MRSSFLDAFLTPGSFFERMKTLAENYIGDSMMFCPGLWWNGVECSVGSWETGLETGFWCCVGGLLKGLYMVSMERVFNWL